MNYCTLFDSNYIDKGIVMIESLFRVDDDANIYVLCMDEKAKLILDELFSDRLNTISLNEFEDKELLEVKNLRSKGEYCWTCTGKLIKYVIQRFQLDICAYVDSDLYFYSNPMVLIEEMKKSFCDVLVVPHRFPPTISGRYQEKLNGRNCVQFNVFSNSKESLTLLQHWIEQCLKECSVNSSGDQKYTDSWGDISFVKISENGGAGMAPWNLTRYKLNSKDNTVFDRYNKESYNMVFYHFQNITYLDRLTVRVLPKIQYWYIDNKLMDLLYIDYLIRIEKTKEMLDKRFGIAPSITTYIASKEKNKKTVKEKMLQIFKEPFTVTLIKLNNVLRALLRRNQTIINLSNYIGETKNDNAK